MMADISVARTSQTWKPGSGQDPARYLVDPGSVKAPGKHSAGGLRYARPYIASGKNFFVFPVGVEGFRRSGQATLGLHHYIGANTVDGTTIHYEEGRIELSGTLPGITAQDNMVACLNILRSQPGDPGLVLYAPGVFEREQYVLAENWDFTHSSDDRTHSIDYTISLVRIGEGTKVKIGPTKLPTPNPTVKTSPRGKPTKIFTVTDGARTLRAIAAKVYGNQDQWQKLVALNQGQLANWQKSNAANSLHGLPTYQLPTFRFPIGTKFAY
jgi:hypothetical protein